MWMTIFICNFGKSKIHDSAGYYLINVGHRRQIAPIEILEAISRSLINDHS